MIKIIIRKNLIYLLFLFISYFSRRVLLIILDQVYGMNTTFLFCFLMVFGEIFGGALIYCYQSTFLKKTKRNNNNLGIFKLIKNESTLNRADGWIKIILLIFFASFFDLIEFMILAYFIPRIAPISSTISLRLCCIITISSSLICFFTLNFNIGKHQKLSLIIMGICSFIIIILEIIFRPEGIEIKHLLFSYVLLFFHFIFLSFTDVVEKYLADYNYLNPLQILMTEGLFSLVMSCIYSIKENPFIEIRMIYNKESTEKFVLLIFLLILYSVLSAGINIYKILCNVLYSPMTKSLSSYFCNFAFIIYYYAIGDDFIIKGKTNFFYFLINLLFSLIIDFFGLIYNEFFILSFCGLDQETHYGIAERANTHEVELYLRRIKNNDDDETDDIEDNMFLF